MTDGPKSSFAGDSTSLKIAPEDLKELYQSETELSQRRNQVHVFDCESGMATPITFTEALAYKECQAEPDQCHVLSFSGLDGRQATQLRKVFHLPPVLDSECLGSVFNTKDSALVLGEHLVLTVSELDADYEEATGVKIILLPSLILLFSTKMPQCLSDMKDLSWTEETDEEGEFRVAIEEEEGCSQVHKVLYKLLETNTLRHERFVLETTVEAKELHGRALDLGHREVDKFTNRVIRVKKYLMIADEIIKPKVDFFKRLSKSQRFVPALLPYLFSLQSRYEAMSLRVCTGNELVKEAERISIVNESARMDSIMARFAAFSVMFLPILTIGSYMGMNVTIPWYLEDDLTAFNWIVGVSVIILAGFSLFFKVKGWL